MRTRLLILGALPLSTPTQDGYHKYSYSDKLPFVWSPSCHCFIYLPSSLIFRGVRARVQLVCFYLWGLLRVSLRVRKGGWGASCTQNAWSFPGPPVCCNVINVISKMTPALLLIPWLNMPAVHLHEKPEQEPKQVQFCFGSRFIVFNYWMSL